NWASYGGEITLATDLDPLARTMLTDPQTSGGLLVACAPELVDAVLGIFRDEGFAQATAIGTLAHGTAGIDVRA
ncbi:MAG: selenide, water dikinase SelD, partial [Thiomonas sp. 20-64-5]